MRLAHFMTALAGAAVVASAASAEADLKAALEARYAAMKAAMAAHNGLAVSDLLAPDFTSVDVMGNTEKVGQMIAEVDALKPDPNKVSTTTLTSMQRVGDTATVEQRYEMHTVKTSADGVPHGVVLVTLSTDTWVCPKGVWLMAKTVTNELTYSVEGNVVAHRTRQ